MARNTGVAVQFVGVVALAWLVAQVLTDCNVCQKNEVACINSTSYYLCFGDGTPHTNNIYSCLEGTVCTERTAICVQKNAMWKPSCGDTSQCGQCSAQRNYKFACQSRRYFQMCYGAARPTGSLGICPSGYVCDAGSDVVCVPERAGQTYTCDVHDDLVVSTTPPPPTDTTTEDTTGSMTARQVCEKRGKTGLYETVPRDAYCKRYISCYFSAKGSILVEEHDCATTSYFDAASQACIVKAPANCTARTRF